MDYMNVDLQENEVATGNARDVNNIYVKGSRLSYETRPLVDDPTCINYRRVFGSNFLRHIQYKRWTGGATWIVMTSPIIRKIIGYLIYKTNDWRLLMKTELFRKVI